MSDPTPLDSRIVKEELFDADAMHGLSLHEGVPETIKKMLKAYRKRAEDGNKVRVVYEYGTTMKELRQGRVQPHKGMGLASFRSDVRAALAAKYYIDIDMVNAQPVLLVQLCKKHGWVCERLEEYVAGRAEKLAEIMEELGCDRDGAKTFCLTILFGARPYKRVSDYFFALAEEMTQIAENCSKEYPQVLAACIKAKKDNPKASCLAQVIQDVEFKVLEMIDAFIAPYGGLRVLIHDGGFVLKERVGNIDTFLCDIEKHIGGRGYSIRLAQKPLEHTFVFSDNEFLPASLVVNDRYAAQRFVELCGDELRKSGPDVYVLKADGRWGKGINDLRAKAFELPLIFKKMGPVAPIIYDYQGKNQNIKAMLENVPILAKEGQVPFQFAYEFSDASGNKERILELVNILISNLAKGDAAVGSYIIHYLAHMIQKPHELPGVALIFTGEKGCGKDTFFDFFGEHVIGKEYYTNYVKTALLFQKHDTLRANKVMIKLEEANRNLCLENDDILKPMITSHTMQVEPKGKDTITLPNYTRTIMTTNSGNPLNFTGDERRFLISNCSSERRGDSAFWTEVRELLFNDSAGAVVAEWLRGHDLTNWAPRTIPIGAYQAGIMEEAVSPLKEFIAQWDGAELDGGAFYNAYRAYCVEKALPYKQNIKSLGVELGVLVDNGGVVKRRTNGGMVYSK